MQASSISVSGKKIVAVDGHACVRVLCSRTNFLIEASLLAFNFSFTVKVVAC